MHSVFVVLFCGVLVISPLSFSLLPSAYASEVGHAAAVAGSSGQSGTVTLAAAPPAIGSPCDVPDATTIGALARRAKSPHISDETPLRQALAPQKSQTPDGACVGLDGQDPNTNTPPSR